MTVPFLGRLNLPEYFALVASFIFVSFEGFIRILTLALPASVISLCYKISSGIFNRLSSPAEKSAQLKNKSISTSIREAHDFVDLCRLFGYQAEEHIVKTEDGCLLGLHRLAWRRGEENLKVNEGPGSLRKPVVYLHHGLLMNSEVWVCLTDEKRNLPFVLVEHGFDVWLGNNRGNKYSKKSVRWPTSSTEFWDFSMDEFALYDVPNSISHILECTCQPSLSYIGFSQGTAQAFAALSINPKLNKQVNVFIALAPAMSPPGLTNGIVDALVKASPQVLFLLFGRRFVHSSAAIWQSILYPPIFVRIIDFTLSSLFHWYTNNITVSQKLAAYAHLHSFTSTKCIVHWFQIMRNKSFQMYDDSVHNPMSLGSSSRFSKTPKYPTRNIKTPIVLVYGGSDSLVDIDVMLQELPPQTVANGIPHYEHLDFLWAQDVDTQVFRHVFDALDSFTDAKHTSEEYSRYRRARAESIMVLDPPRYLIRNGVDGIDGTANKAGGAPQNAQASPSPSIQRHSNSEQDPSSEVGNLSDGSKCECSDGETLRYSSSEPSPLRDSDTPSSTSDIHPDDTSPQSSLQAATGQSFRPAVVKLKSATTSSASGIARRGRGISIGKMGSGLLAKSGAGRVVSTESAQGFVDDGEARPRSGGRE